VERFEGLAFAVPRTAFLGPADFNALDGGLCDGFGAELWLFFLFLLDLPAGGMRDFGDFFFADVLEAARRGARTRDLGDFLRLFLDIRLPFVAFRRSIIAILRQMGIMRAAGRAGPARSMLKASWIRYPFASECGLCRMTSVGAR